MLRPSVLLLAALLTSRSFWLALVENQLSLTTAVIWFLVAIPLSGGILAGLGSLMTAYGRANRSTRLATEGDGVAGEDPPRT